MIVSIRDIPVGQKFTFYGHTFVRLNDVTNSDSRHPCRAKWPDNDHVFYFTPRAEVEPYKEPELPDEKFTVYYTIKCSQEVSCPRKNLEDVITNLDFPEEYCDDSFELIEVLDSDGKRVKIN